MSFSLKSLDSSFSIPEYIYGPLPDVYPENENEKQYDVNHDTPVNIVYREKPLCNLFPHSLNRTTSPEHKNLTNRETSQKFRDKQKQITLEAEFRVENFTLEQQELEKQISSLTMENSDLNNRLNFLREFLDTSMHKMLPNSELEETKTQGENDSL